MCQANPLLQMVWALYCWWTFPVNVLWLNVPSFLVPCPDSLSWSIWHRVCCHSKPGSAAAPASLTHGCHNPSQHCAETEIKWPGWWYPETLGLLCTAFLCVLLLQLFLHRPSMDSTSLPCLFFFLTELIIYLYSWKKLLLLIQFRAPLDQREVFLFCLQSKGRCNFIWRGGHVEWLG